MKKTKLPGDNISLKTKKTEDPLVMAWLNAQTNLMDSFRYLVEKEIMSNGVRNLQAFIPAERSGLQVSPPVKDPLESQQMKDLQELHLLLKQAVLRQDADASQAGRQQLAAAAEDEKRKEAEALSAASAEEEIDDEDIEAWS